MIDFTYAVAFTPRISAELNRSSSFINAITIKTSMYGKLFDEAFTNPSEVMTIHTNLSNFIIHRIHQTNCKHDTRHGMTLDASGQGTKQQH